MILTSSRLASVLVLAGSTGLAVLWGFGTVGAPPVLAQTAPTTCLSGDPFRLGQLDPLRGKLTPSVVALVSTSLCLTCSQPELYPNVAHRITPDLLGKISAFREMLP